MDFYNVGNLKETGRFFEMLRDSRKNMSKWLINIGQSSGFNRIELNFNSLKCFF